MAPDPLPPGSSLQEGRFVIVGVIARGGQAVTFEGIDKRHGQRVAIKRFQVSGASSWKDVELAEREAKVLSALSHANLPKYVAHFEEGGSLYLVMEYVAGPTLEQLRSSHSLQQADILSFLREMAETLEYLHHHSPPIIHRDIKPRNVIRRPDGHFTLVDFGSVRDKLRPEGGSTVVGTFGYMAPEQFQGRAMPATDVYATAATALAMLTALEPDQLPHQGLRIDVDAALDASVSPRLKRLLHQALNPDPDLRGGQSLRQLLASHQLLTDNGAAPHRATRKTARGRNESKASAPRSRAQQQDDFATSGMPPFNTQGHRRRRSARSRPENDRSSPPAVPDLEAGVTQVLQHQAVKNALRMPLVMTAVVVILVLVRAAVWLMLGVVLPTLFGLLHAILRLPLAQAARESMAAARALRAQFRRISKQLRAARRGALHVSSRAPDSAQADPAASDEHTRYRVHTEPDTEPGPQPDRERKPKARSRAGSDPEQFADDLEREAEKLEQELERTVLSWQGRISDRK